MCRGAHTIVFHHLSSHSKERIIIHYSSYHMKPQRKHWKPAFLAIFAETGSVSAACDAAGINRRTAYYARNSDAKFAADWKEALENAMEKLEAIAYQKALEGASGMLKFLLQAHKPEVYRQPSKNVSMNITPEQLDKMTDEEIIALYEKLHGKKH